MHPLFIDDYISPKYQGAKNSKITNISFQY